MYRIKGDRMYTSGSTCLILATASITENSDSINKFLFFYI